MASPDLIVVGAGIMGLSVAWAARRAGLSVCVIDRDRPGAGASGGVVGALTPHAPRRWRPMMAFQFQALLDLPDRIAEIEDITGIDTGYAVTGRMTPLPTRKARAQAEEDAQTAPTVWGSAARYRVHDNVPGAMLGWISPEYARFGVVEDTVSARVAPRRYVAALAAGIGDRALVRAAVERVLHDGTVHCRDAQVSAPAVVLAGGVEGWGLARHLAPAFEGTAVKGQSAVLAVDAAGLPVLYQDGLYIVPHGDGQVAVGSTSEKRFDGCLPDDLLDDVLARARVASPRLSQAQVVERWAGLRPKPPGREPLIGRVPDSRVWLATGGFKISFGIAHAVGDALVADIIGKTPTNPLPATFDPALRVERA